MLSVLHRQGLTNPSIHVQVVTDTLALLVAALPLLPDRQPAIMSTLLMLLIEVAACNLCLYCRNSCS